jgi:hypothetical protein
MPSLAGHRHLGRSPIGPRSNPGKNARRWKVHIRLITAGLMHDLACGKRNPLQVVFQAGILVCGQRRKNAVLPRRIVQLTGHPTPPIRDAHATVVDMSTSLEDSIDLKTCRVRAVAHLDPTNRPG